LVVLDEYPLLWNEATLPEQSSLVKLVFEFRHLTTAVSMAFMPPGINHEKEKNQETQQQQNDSSRLVFPQELKIGGDFVQIHLQLPYIKTDPKKESSNLRKSNLARRHHFHWLACRNLTR